MISKYLANLAAIAPARLDSWTNFFTGLGDPSRDNTEQGRYNRDFRLTDFELSALYEGDAIARKIIRTIPLEMLRGGFRIQSVDKVGAKKVQDRARVLNVREAVLDAYIWARLYGGSVIFIGADDGQDPASPLARDLIRNVAFLQVYDRRMATPSTYYEDPRAPKFGQPNVYMLTSLRGTISWVHESRLVIFPGAHTDPQTKLQLAGWDNSELQAPYNVLRAFWATYKSGEHLVADASQAVIKVRNLFGQIASGDLQNLITRARFLDMSRSVARAILLDADGNESFEKVQTTFAGIPDMLDRFNNLLSATAEIPVTVLMGTSPAGLNATGASDFRGWYDKLERDRENDLKPLLEDVIDLIRLGCQVQAPLVLSFPSFWQETPKEKADRQLSEAQGDQIRIQTGVLDPDEVAIARYSEEPTDIIIDPATRGPLPVVDPKSVPGALPSGGQG